MVRPRKTEAAPQQALEDVRKEQVEMWSASQFEKGSKIGAWLVKIRKQWNLADDELPLADASLHRNNPSERVLLRLASIAPFCSREVTTATLLKHVEAREGTSNAKTTPAGRATTADWDWLYAELIKKAKENARDSSSDASSTRSSPEPEDDSESTTQKNTGETPTNSNMLAPPTKSTAQKSTVDTPTKSITVAATAQSAAPARQQASANTGTGPAGSTLPTVTSVVGQRAGANPGTPQGDSETPPIAPSVTPAQATQPPPSGSETNPLKRKRSDITSLITGQVTHLKKRVATIRNSIQEMERELAELRERMEPIDKLRNELTMNLDVKKKQSEAGLSFVGELGDFLEQCSEKPGYEPWVAQELERLPALRAAATKDWEAAEAEVSSLIGLKEAAASDIQDLEGRLRQSRRYLEADMQKLAKCQTSE
ncbi:hypothetical protein QBC47DRAFT_395573 [Echria macrotheca]|uniref:Uncharacterized protein n=1 Tax=Echria macrotheca TaxID=438768 RepID=A0AAJ0B0W9_9PEZI|nr:hypothetical protein QBC47DRAFT_395573 [Echria macrotheca]